MKQKPTREPIANEAANGVKNKQYTVAMARTSRSAFGVGAVLHQRRRQRFPRLQVAGRARLGLLRVRQGRRRHATSSTRSRACDRQRSGIHQNVPKRGCRDAARGGRDGLTRRPRSRAAADAHAAPGERRTVRCAADAATLFLSDLHLAPERPAPPPRFTRSRAVRRAMPRRCTSSGDLFDWWIGDDQLARAVRGGRSRVAARAHRCRRPRASSRAAIAISCSASASSRDGRDAAARAAGRRGRRRAHAACTHGDELCTGDAEYQALPRAHARARVGAPPAGAAARRCAAASPGGCAARAAMRLR